MRREREIDRADRDAADWMAAGARELEQAGRQCLVPTPAIRVPVMNRSGVIGTPCFWSWCICIPATAALTASSGSAATPTIW